MPHYYSSLVLLSVFAAALGSASLPESMRSFFFPPHTQQQMGSVQEERGTEDMARKIQEDREKEIQEARRLYISGDASRYAAPPVTHAPQCHVEVQVSERHPGRCIRLGGVTPACQTSEYVSINFNECR